MYGFPKNFDPDVFIGLTLEMICFNFNQIYLHFDKQTSITIEATLTYQMADGKEPLEISPPVLSSNLMGLLEHKVISATSQSDGTLSLTFDNGHIVKCLDPEPNYESYKISLGTTTIIV